MRRSLGSVLVLALSLPAVAWAQAPLPPASDGESIESDQALPLNTPRDEAGDDGVVARALFAHGRMLQQRRDTLAALRRYQRAYRYDAQLRGRQEIVSLAMELGRMEEAGRYALLPGKDTAADSLQLRRLALDATNRRDWKQAAALYEASLARSQELGLRTATHVLLRAELGRLYFLDQQYEKAHQSLAEVRAALAEPEDYDLSESSQKIILGKREETYGLMARCALEAGQLDEAEKLFAEAHRDAADSTAALMDNARVLQRREQWDDLEKLVGQILERADFDSALPVEWLRLALSKKLAADQVEPAVAERLQAAHDAHPENPILRIELARSLANHGQLDEAAQLLSEGLDTNPPVELKDLYAEVLRKQNLPEKWLALSPRSESEITAAAADDPFVMSVLEIVRTLPAGSDESRPKLRVGAALALLRKEAEAATGFWESSLETAPKERAESLLLWGLKLVQADEYRLSMAAFQQSIDLAAGDLASRDIAPAYFYLSGSAALAGEHEAALTAARKAIEVRPADIRFLAREAWVLHHAKQNAEARTKYEALLAQFDKSADAEVRSALREARLVLASLCAEMGDADAAIEYLEQVLDEYPEDVGALNDLGYLWADRSQHLQRALRMVQRAVAAEPENKAFRDSLGWVNFRLGRFPEALAELEKAAAGDDPGGIVLDHLGDALARAGRPAEAHQAWQRALEAFRKEGNAPRSTAVERKLKHK